MTHFHKVDDFGEVNPAVLKPGYYLFKLNLPRQWVQAK